MLFQGSAEEHFPGKNSGKIYNLSCLQILIHMVPAQSLRGHETIILPKCHTVKMLEWSPDSQTASRLVRVAKRYISPKIAHLSPLHPNASCRAEKKGVNGRMAMAPRMFHVIPLVLFQLAIKYPPPTAICGVPTHWENISSPPPSHIRKQNCFSLCTSGNWEGKDETSHARVQWLSILRKKTSTSTRCMSFQTFSSNELKKLFIDVWIAHLIFDGKRVSREMGANMNVGGTHAY